MQPQFDRVGESYRHAVLYGTESASQFKTRNECKKEHPGDHVNTLDHRGLFRISLANRLKR